MPTPFYCLNFFYLFQTCLLVLENCLQVVWKCCKGEYWRSFAHKLLIILQCLCLALVVPHLIDFLLSRGGYRTVLCAVCLTVTVTGFAVGTGTACVSQFFFLIPALVLVLVVKHSLKVHYCPSMPGLQRQYLLSQILTKLKTSQIQTQITLLNSLLWLACFFQSM